MPSTYAWGQMHTLPDWNDIATLLAIHECGSLSAAARANGVSQSTMSRRLAAIEASGIRVFSRNADGTVHLAPEGEPILEAARSMDAAYRTIVESLNSKPRPLRIAACEVTAQLFLTEALAEWSTKSNHAADLSVYDDLFGLPGNAWDILVTPIDGLPGTMNGTRIGAMGFGLYASPSYLSAHPFRAGSNSLSGHKVIGASGSLAQVSAWAWLAAQGGNIVFSSSSVTSLLGAAARGQGIALLPIDVAKGYARLEHLDHPVPPPADVWILATHSSAGYGGVSGFLRWARQHFKERPSKIVQKVQHP